MDYASFSGRKADKVVDYIYDVENHWIGRLVDADGDGKVDSQTGFAYDSNQIVLQFDKQGEGKLSVADLSHRYLCQPNAVDQLMADEQITDVATPGNTVWTLGDNLGTPRDLAVHDQKTGVTSVANHRSFDSFGKLEMQTNAAVDCLFGLTGKPVDSNTGLRSHWRRWTDAETANWTSVDPTLFNAGDPNPTRYCGGSPTNATDPTGLDWIRLNVDGETINIDRHRMGVPILHQFRDSTVEWVVEVPGTLWNSNQRSVRIGTATTQYEDHYIGDEWVWNTSRIIASNGEIKLDQQFGGGTIKVSALNQAAQLVWKLTDDKGLSSLKGIKGSGVFSPHDLP